MLMTTFEKKEGSLNSFADAFIISKTAVYRWVNKYKDILLSEGIITEKRKGGQKFIYVNDIDSFIEFFKERDIYLTEE